MSISPGLVLALTAAAIGNQASRIVLPVRNAWFAGFLLSVGGVLAGELAAGSSWLGGPSLGVLHPLPDAIGVIAFQVMGLVMSLGTDVAEA